MTLIKFSPQDMRDSATVLQQHAADMNQHLDDFATALIDPTVNGWKGEAQEAFVVKHMDWHSQMCENVGAMKVAAQALTKVADAHEQLQSKTAAAFQAATLKPA
jgi:WXG100 family type VII secretion target